MPFLPHSSQRQEGRHGQVGWRNTAAVAKGAVAPKDGETEQHKCLLEVWLLGQASAAVSLMGESDFHDVG